MKSFLSFLETNTKWLLILFCLLAGALHMQNFGFPPFNSDEASFAYNAYSIAETARDEYGTLLPSRFKAFGENKLPVTIYLIAPFVKVLGLTEFASRLPFILIGIFSPLLFYFVTKKAFNNNAVALIASFLAGVSPWIQIMSRHIHENLIILALTLTAFWLLMRLIDKFTYRDVILFSVINGVSLFTYHIGKMLAVYFFVLLIWIAFQQRKKFIEILKVAVIFLIPVIIFFGTELQNPTTRVSNLLFINNEGFTGSIVELRSEHDNRLIHNKATQSVITLTHKYLSYYSPEFLVMNGDSNVRFGMPGISPISAVEYLLLFIGLFYIFKNNEKYRFLFISLFLAAPLTASLSWQDASLTRSFLLIIPILMFVSYGLYNVARDLQQIKFSAMILLVIIAAYGYFTFYSWDFYFNHYPKRLETAYAWQAGYKEVNEFIKENYNVYGTFYITKRLGQPYIFTLFYLPYEPKQYQKEAQLTELGEYGFGEVERFDKFEFNFPQINATGNTVYIGYPEDFAGTNVQEKDVKKISYKGHEMFWIYTGVIE